jgi:hypothetical protein
MHSGQQDQIYHLNVAHNIARKSVFQKKKKSRANAHRLNAVHNIILDNKKN